MTITDAATERFLDGPAPYGSGNPVPTTRPRYKTAEQELAEALEGTAPALSNKVAGLIGPTRTLELAKAVRRATDLAVRRHAAEQLAGALALVEEAVDGIPAECVSPEVADV